MCSTSSPYPRAWARRLNELSGVLTLEVAGLNTDIEVTAEQLRRAYLPTLGLIVRQCNRRARAGQHQPAKPRLLVGLAGIGASGKSTFAAVLAQLAQRLLPEYPLAVVGMDGWHYPNAVLDARWTTDPTGRPISLRRRKGGPDSFDVSALVTALHELRTAGRTVTLPRYDRRRHDPVPGALTVPAETRIVLLEGNYILSADPPWDEVAALLDLRLYLTCDEAAARSRMIARHIRGGSTEAAAVQKYEENDGLNARIIAATAVRAEHVVDWSGPG